MNTKKVIFGILAVVLLVATSVSTVTLDDQDTGVKKSKIIINKK